MSVTQKTTVHHQIWIVGVLAVFLLVNYLTIGLEAAPRPDEERYFDREDIQNVATWLALLPQAGDSQFLRAPISSPCNPATGANYRSSGGGGSSASAPMLASVNKRNSELINSLLSLPKTMNNAGK